MNSQALRRRCLEGAVLLHIDPDGAQVVNTARDFERFVLQSGGKKQPDRERAIEARLRGVELAIELSVQRRQEAWSTTRARDLHVNFATIHSLAETFAEHLLGSTNGQTSEVAA
jgi:hypothetical protein